MIDVLINIISAIIDNVANVMPVQFGGLSVNDFANNFYRGFIHLTDPFNFIESFFPVGFIFVIFGMVIFLELLSSFVVRGVFWIIRTIRGG